MKTYRNRKSENNHSMNELFIGELIFEKKIVLEMKSEMMSIRDWRNIRLDFL